MRKFYFVLFSLSILLILISTNGCKNSTSVDYPSSILYGRVVDSSTHSPIDSAYVNTDPPASGCYTDANGNYRLGDISMPSSGKNCYLVVMKGNYETARIGLWILAGDSLNVDVSLLSSNAVFLKDNLILQQYSNLQSLSSADLVNMVPTAGNYTYRDIDFRDSMSLGQRFQFRSAFNDQVNIGLETKFGNSLGNFTKYQFDTLKMIYGANEPLNENDFPLTKTPYFTAPLAENSVYPFYLKGRTALNPGSHSIYGLLYLEAAWIDQGTLNVRLDIKENRSGQNYFIIGK